MPTLKVKKVRLAEAGVDFRQLTQDHLAVRLRNLFPGSRVPCDLYFPYFHGERSVTLEKTLARGSVYTQAFHDRLTSHGIRVFYIRRGDESAFADYFDQQLQGTIHSPNIPPEVKTQLIYDGAENIVKKVLREHPDPTNIALGRRFVTHFSTHLANDAVTGEALLAIFAKDYYTFTHSVQVSLLGMAFCRFLGWPEKDIQGYGLGALFHDVGKSLIDDAILNKPGKLNSDEFGVMKSHPVLGYQRVKATQVLTAEQLSVILHHHEAMDGSGYPNGLAGEQIPLVARIGRIADCFDALTTNRPYKKAMPPAEAIKIMNDQMGHTFDQQLLKRFVRFLGLEEAVGIALEKRPKFNLGIKVAIEVLDNGVQLDGLLVGMETDRYLIVRLPAGDSVGNLLPPGQTLKCRCLCRGQVIQFRTEVLTRLFEPLSLAVMRFPIEFQLDNLRKHPRLDCFLPAAVDIGGVRREGILGDISVGGCQFILQRPSTKSEAVTAAGEAITVLVNSLGEAGALPLPGVVKHVVVDAEKLKLGIEFALLNGTTHRQLSAYIENALALVQ